MQQKLRNSLVFLISMVLMLGVLTSVTAEEFDPMKKYDEPVQITTVRAVGDSLQKFIDKKNDVLTDNIWFRSYRDELGIEVSYQWTAPAAQYNEKINTQIAANDLPDIIPVNQDQLNMLVEYGGAYDLTELFEKYATPFTKSMMEADMHVGLTQATFDGKLMALPLVSGSRDGSNLWWIRYDWLEKLGLDEPTTFRELIDVMYAFAKNDPDGNGVDDTYGMGLHKLLFGGNMGIAALGDGLRAYVDGWVELEDGSLGYGSIQPETKKMLEALSKLYADGVIDKEFIVKDSGKVAEEIVAGKIGMFGGQHYQAFWPLQDAINADPTADWRAISIVSDDGEKARTMLHGSASTFYVVNVDCEHPEAAIKLYNYFYAKDPALSPDFDLHYHGRLDADPESEVTEYYQWAIMTPGYPMQNLFIHRGVDAYFEGDKSVTENYWIADNVDQNERYLAGDMSFWATKAWSGPSDYSGEGRIDYYDKNDMFIQNAYIKANTESMVLYNTTLNQLRLEAFTKIIIGEAPIEAFDDYVAQWKQLGGDAITKEVNDAK